LTAPLTTAEAHAIVAVVLLQTTQRTPR